MIMKTILQELGFFVRMAPVCLASVGVAELVGLWAILLAFPIAAAVGYVEGRAFDAGERTGARRVGK